MKKFTTLVGAGLVAASVLMAAPALAAGPAAPGHSEVGAVNPVPTPPSSLSRVNQPVAGQSSGKSWWSGELADAATVVGVAAAIGAPVLGPSLTADKNLLNAAADITGAAPGA